MVRLDRSTEEIQWILSPRKNWGPEFHQ